jgi:predicted PurR-regulated permease PerM
MTQRQPDAGMRAAGTFPGGRLFAYLLIGAAVAVVLLLGWRLSHVLLLAFGSVLVAVLLRSLTELITRYTPLGDGAALAASVALLAIAALTFLLLLGTQIRAQFDMLVEEIPQLIATMEELTGAASLGGWLEESAGRVIGGGDLLGSLAGYSGALLTTIAHVVIVIFAGLYLALDPSLYLRGLVSLLPRRHRATAQDALQAVGRALRLWLMGQLVAMILVGSLTTLGLWLIGVPSALALGVIAALLEFVPFAGPVLASVPAIALGLSESVTTGALVLGLYLVIQQVEGNLITPLVHQRAVDLPPALTMFAILAFGVLFGWLGILLATPLAVVGYVLVNRLWIEEVLGEPAHLPGEDETGGEAP